MRILRLTVLLWAILPGVAHAATAFQITVTGRVPDPMPADNTASETVGVAYDSTLTPEDAAPGGGDGGATKTAPTVAALTPAPATFRAAKTCTRRVMLSGRFTADGDVGTNRLRFTGRLGGLRLAPRRYRLGVTAAGPRGEASPVRRAAFRIVA